jgi:flagella basal body P-ring formation protein FlgA
MKRALILFFTASAWACQIVDGDRILGKDLGAANPAFASLDPALDLGATPMAGVRRMFHASLLARLARENSIALAAPIAEVCFERATEPLTAAKLLPALERAVGLAGAKVEILDYSRYGVPRGDLEFTRSGLSASGMWRGRVVYSDRRSAPVWARVRVTTEQTWLEAVQPLTAGAAIQRADLAVRHGPRFPFGPEPVAAVDRAAGLTPVRTIPGGATLFATMLVAPREVERGDKVSVQVSSGGARISFDGTAESSGRAGETVLIRNPANGRLFQGRIQSKGKVVVKL